jgi:hypothetical protein
MAGTSTPIMTTLASFSSKEGSTIFALIHFHAPPIAYGCILNGRGIIWIVEKYYFSTSSSFYLALTFSLQKCSTSVFIR